MRYLLLGTVLVAVVVAGSLMLVGGMLKVMRME